MYIRYNDGKAHITIATGKYSTHFKAEPETLKKKKKKKKKKKEEEEKKKLQLRSETTCPKPSAMWSCSQML